jgi:motility quorum-sensing regulator / GCU-specific mRNA interferase toxin
MEKSKPHCKLARVFALIAAQQVRITFAARSGAQALDFDVDAMLAAVGALRADDFYKSMTTHADHRIWQDVYRPRLVARGVLVTVYIKLTVIDDLLIVSFKEK